MNYHDRKSAPSAKRTKTSAPSLLPRRVMENLRASQAYTLCLLEVGRAESQPRFHEVSPAVLLRIDSAMDAFEDAALLVIGALAPQAPAAARAVADLERQRA